MSEPVDLRILQANERTLLAWIRTGLALIAFGFVIDRLALWFRFELHQEETRSLVLGSIVIVIGAACEVIGTVRFIKIRRALLAGQPAVPGQVGPVVVALLVTVIAAALLAYVLAS